jgi:hypothetical protein
MQKIDINDFIDLANSFYKNNNFDYLEEIKDFKELDYTKDIYISVDISFDNDIARKYLALELKKDYDVHDEIDKQTKNSVDFFGVIPDKEFYEKGHLFVNPIKTVGYTLYDFLRDNKNLFKRISKRYDTKIYVNIHQIGETILGDLVFDKDNINSEINLYVDFKNERHMQVGANIILLCGYKKDKNNLYNMTLWLKD